jgi:hypothetical protein
MSRSHRITLPFGKCDRLDCERDAIKVKTAPARLFGVMVLTKLHICEECEGDLAESGTLPQIRVVNFS